MASQDMQGMPSEEHTKITFQFCREWYVLPRHSAQISDYYRSLTLGSSNLLYPQEEEQTQKLIYQCRTCPYATEAASSCVYRNELSSTVGETAGITQDVGSDPTVGDLPVCTMCGQEIVCEQCGQPVIDGYLCLEVEDMSVNDDSQSTPEAFTLLEQTEEHRA